MSWSAWLLGAGLLLAVRLYTEPLIRFVRKFLQDRGVDLPEPVPPPSADAERNTLGDAAYATGIVSLLVFLFPPATIALGAGAIFLGFVARRRPEEKTARNRGRARSGMELGIFAIPWGLFWWDIINQLSQSAL